MMQKNLPKIAFLPAFENFGDTFPLVEIAKHYVKLGGNVVFIGYKDEYEKIVRDNDFEIINTKKIIPPDFIKEYEAVLQQHFYHNRAREIFFREMFDDKRRQIRYKTIEQELKIFKENKIKLAVSAFNFTSLISTKILKIPLVVLLSGVATKSYFQSNHATFPDNYENLFTKIFPKFIKNRITNMYILKSKMAVKGYNVAADKYRVSHVKRFLDLLYGDLTLVVDDNNFLKIKPSAKFSGDTFIGPIIPKTPFGKNEEFIEPDVEKHINKPGRSILFSFASSGTIKSFTDILNALNKTDYNVVAVYTTIFDRAKLPSINENILLKKFVPSIKKINEAVDLAIIHGGRGTVYTAAYSGKPVIGIPMHSEQQHNLDNLVRNNMAIRISRKYFKEKKFLKTIDKIFTNYNYYLQNAQKLKSNLPSPNGAENAVKEILEFIKCEKNQMRPI